MITTNRIPVETIKRPDEMPDDVTIIARYETSNENRAVRWCICKQDVTPGYPEEFSVLVEPWVLREPTEVGFGYKVSNRPGGWQTDDAPCQAKAIPTRNGQPFGADFYEENLADMMTFVISDIELNAKKGIEQRWNQETEAADARERRDRQYEALHDALDIAVTQNAPAAD